MTQSEEAIRHILQEARRSPNTPPAPPVPSGTSAGAPGGIPAGNHINPLTDPGRDYIEECEIDADTFMSEGTITELVEEKRRPPAREP